MLVFLKDKIIPRKWSKSLRPGQEVIPQVTNSLLGHDDSFEHISAVPPVIYCAGCEHIDISDAEVNRSGIAELELD